MKRLIIATALALTALSCNPTFATSSGETLEEMPVQTTLHELFDTAAADMEGNTLSKLASCIDQTLRAPKFGMLAEGLTLDFMVNFAKRYGRFSYLSCISTPDGFYIHITMDRQDPKEAFRAIISCYEEQMTMAQTFMEKVLASIECAHSLVMLHPHMDGNTRTFMTLALNKLLMELGLPLSSFENPNWFDGRTVQESLPLIAQAIENSEIVQSGRLPAGMPKSEELIARDENAAALVVRDEMHMKMHMNRVLKIMEDLARQPVQYLAEHNEQNFKPLLRELGEGRFQVTIHKRKMTKSLDIDNLDDIAALQYLTEIWQSSADMFFLSKQAFKYDVE